MSTTGEYHVVLFFKIIKRLFATAFLLHFIKGVRVSPLGLGTPVNKVIGLFAPTDFELHASLTIIP